MLNFVFTDNASTTLVEEVVLRRGSDYATEMITVAPGTGDLFADAESLLDDGHQPLTLTDGAKMARVYLTNRDGDLLTILHQHQDNSPMEFGAGTKLECRLTAEVMSLMVEKILDLEARVTSLQGSV